MSPINDIYILMMSKLLLGGAGRGITSSRARGWGTGVTVVEGEGGGDTGVKKEPVKVRSNVFVNDFARF